MKVAVVGCGHWGRKHVQEYIALGCDVSACDPDPASAGACRRMGASVTTLASILDDGATGHVSVCAPNRLHYEIAYKAAARKKHLLVEKPMCSTVGQARRLTRLSDARGTKLLCGHVFRFNGAVRRVAGMAAEGRFGEVWQIKFTWHQTLDYVRDRNIVADIGLHPIDIADLLTDGAAPASVKCIPRAFDRAYAQSAVLSYDVRHGGRRINVTADLNWAAPCRREALILGSGGAARVQCVDQEIELYEGGRGRRLKHEANNTIRDQLAYFTKSARADVQGGDKANGPTATRVLSTVEKAGSAPVRARPAR